jgi:thiamine biosynthesis protein ThiS
VNITVNGETRSIDDGATVLTLLDSLNLPADTTVVERNADILNRDDFADTTLADGDSLEVVRFVGGG